MITLIIIAVVFFKVGLVPAIVAGFAIHLCKAVFWTLLRKSPHH